LKFTAWYNDELETFLATPAEGEFKEEIYGKGATEEIAILNMFEGIEHEKANPTP